MGGIALLRKEFARAEKLLEVALTKDWHDDWQRKERSRCLLALAKLEKGDLPSAFSLIEEAVGSIPDFLPARWLVASTLERMGNREAALTAYRFLLLRQPDHAAATLAIRRLGGS
jgi:Tfp pilus assembly protein PilF